MWNLEEAELIEFAQVWTPPNEGFMLKPWIRICDPVQWKKAILQDLSSGPEGIRALTGALMRDLEALRDHEVRKLLDE